VNSGGQHNEKVDPARVRALLTSLITVLLFAIPASAATMWTNWTTAVNGNPGSASGVFGGVNVSYSGQVIGSVLNGTSNIWAPNSSFTGGTVTTSPSIVGDDIRLNGIGFTGPNTITFSSSVDNPVFAIWSLGAPGTPATFTFNATPTLEAGGPNSLFGGSSISVSGNVVSGIEGNGVVQFTGTFTSISWTDTPENFYAFTVGLNGPSGPPGIPEPSSIALIGIGLAGLALWRRMAR
jgi:hypothetical protein